MTHDARQPDGATPLLLAVERSDAALTRLLLDHGADPAAPGPGRRTARDLSADHPQLAALLAR